MKIMRDCRNALLPDLNELVDKQQSACKLLGIEREDIELDVLGVETFEQSLGRKLEEAKQKGERISIASPNSEICSQP